jgi:DNA helicase HerA-like ATPase
MDNKVAAASQSAHRIGAVIEVSGFRISCELLGERDGGAASYNLVQIGDVIRIPTPTTVAFGFVDRVAFESASSGEARGQARAEIDLLGELKSVDGKVEKAFIRGITVYPVLGAAIFPASEDDMVRIYGKPGAATLAIGSLHQFPDKTAYLKSEIFFSKHSAIVGTTGAGKSCALALILRTALKAHPYGHVLLLDPHGEYGPAFSDMAENITPDDLNLPYWLFGFDEMVQVICSREPIARSRETLILKDAIVYAKRDFLTDAKRAAEITVDTPTPYLMNEVLWHINNEMGKLLRPDTFQPYLRLISNIEGMMRDIRYRFMFGPEAAHEDMAEILGRILRIPVGDRPISILDISGVPSEITNVVVSLICRLVFDFAVRGDRDNVMPIMVACDEAHRYVPRDDSPGFEPARLSFERIAKEGRKYGVSLCLVTQRPSELSQTVLSQCSTVIALRMSNREDQDYVRGQLPDAARGLLNMLPTLGQQEAILVGEGAVHPMRVRFGNLEEEHRPRVAPTSFPQAWDKDEKGRDYLADIIRRWRGW